MSTPRTATRKTTPDDQPFDFNLDAVKAEAELRPFRFHWGGRRFEMQHMEALDVWPLMEAAEGGDMAATRGIFQQALGDEWADFRKEPMPQFKLKALFKAYRDFCGVAEGESGASSGS